jgi:hypothetical protein
MVRTYGLTHINLHNPTDQTQCPCPRLRATRVYAV